MKHQLILSVLVAIGVPFVYGQNYFDDDIYYNPDKDKNKKVATVKKQEKKSPYIANMADMDVDAYNRRGEAYYTTAIDTIGRAVENGEDFVYTQQIQKYYNPTIVVDNADMLGDVLANAYGNVEIVIDNNGLPVFAPYSYAWNYPYYRWGYPGWGTYIGPWGWSLSFYDPWYAWNWGWNYGPTWAWGPGWNWGPAWSWGWSWGWGGPGWGGPGGGHPHYADYRPAGNATSGPRPGWSQSTRPGSNNLAHRVPANRGNSVAGSRPAASGTRPGVNSNNGTASNRPNAGHVGVVNNNGRWEYNTTARTGHRNAGTGAVNSQGGRYNSTSNNRGNVTNNRGYNTTTNSSNRSYNTNNRNTNTNTNNNRSYNTNTTRSYNSGGSFGGGNRGGGSFGGGGGRSTGGGGGRHR